MTKTFLQIRTESSFDDLPESFKHGLATAKWPGRCQTIIDPIRSGVTWYLDGAHTVESLECCMQWFGSPGVAVVTEEKYVQPMNDASRGLI